MNTIFAIATGIMFAFGVYQLLRRDLIKSAMGFYILFTAINLLLLAVGAFDGVVPAYVDSSGVPIETPSDPLVQALILTAIVISFGTYALLLGMIAVTSRRFKTVDSDRIDNLKR
jgi:multicomponent Na+:H+ antiporter subunit C